MADCPLNQKRMNILPLTIDWNALGALFDYDPKQPLLFSSALFMFLFLAFTFVYGLLHKQQTLRLLFVTLFSYYFYYKSSGTCFLLLLIVTITDWLLGYAIGNARNAGQTRKARWFVALSCIVDLGLLAYFKYTNFLASTFASLAGWHFQTLDIVLPVGISFYTFQSLSYTIDVYKGKVKPVCSFLDYAFFVSFFPLLVAGPIVKAHTFIPQIRRKVIISSTMLASGVAMIAVGLFKKAVISDYISLNFVDRIFDNPSLYSGIENLLGLYGYAVQIYCDFSGYSDMAIGIAILLGFHVPLNFNNPYTSTSVSDFWRRWHISLSTWLRDYVYIPLGGNRRGKVRTYINSLATMLLCGLWHGAAFNFIIWGLLHGVAVAIHKFTSENIFHHDRHYVSRGWRRWGAVIVTFHFVVFCWMIFRMPDMDVCMVMLRKIFTELHPELFFDIVSSYKEVFVLILLGLASQWFPRQKTNHLVAILSRTNIIVHALVLIVVIYIVIQVKGSDLQPFIYFQF